MFFIERIQIPGNVIINIQQGNGRLNILWKYGKTTVIKGLRKTEEKGSIW